MDCLSTTIIGVLGSTIAIVAIVANRKTAKLKNTADILIRWREDEQVKKGLSVLRDWHNDDEKSVAVLATSNQNKEDLDNLRYLLNFMEDIAAGVKHDIYDEKFLRSSIRTIVINTWKMAKPFIDEIRTKHNNDAFYEHLESLKDSFSKQ